MIHPDRRHDICPEDLAKATLVTVTNNISAIARMSAKISVSPLSLSSTPGKVHCQAMSVSLCVCVCVCVCV